MIQLADDELPRQVVGVVSNARVGLLWRPEDAYVYRPIGSRPAYAIFRAPSWSDSTAESTLRSVAAGVHPALRAPVRAIDESLAQTYAPFRFLAAAAGLIAALTLMLASVGLYGVVSLMVSQRTQNTTLTVKLTSKAARAAEEGGVLRESGRWSPTDRDADLTLPANGTWVDFGLGGRQGKPSVDDLDCLLMATGGGASLTVPLMVRVRKNANKLKPRERDRFLLALAKLNSGTPAPSAYQTLRNMHVDRRRWRGAPGTSFPALAPNVSARSRTPATGDRSVSVHALLAFRPAGTQGIYQARSWAKRSGCPTRLISSLSTLAIRWWGGSPTPFRASSARSLFNTQTEAAPGLPGFALLNQAQTLALGSNYPAFRGMEGTPHGAAHVSFNGWVSQIPTAPKDPLFFMLHSNVDRLWALWQWMNQRTNPDDPNTYTGQNRDGRRVNDTMWPWNGVITPPRPNFAPGNGLPVRR